MTFDVSTEFTGNHHVPVSDNDAGPDESLIPDEKTMIASEDELLERLRVGHTYLCSRATLIGLIGRSSRRTSGWRFSFG